MNWYVLSKKKKKKKDEKKKNTNVLPKNEFYSIVDGVMMFETPSMDSPMIAETEEVNKVPNVES